MADNYLEKRMEEYRAGKLAPKNCVIYAQGPKRDPGDFKLTFPQMRIVVFGGRMEFVGALVKAFRGVGASVAVCHFDKKSCTPLSQAHGCRYYPFDPVEEGCIDRVIDDLAVRWGGVDVAVDLRSDGDTPDDESEGTDSEVSGIGYEAMAELILLHSHPKFGFIGRTELVDR